MLQLETVLAACAKPADVRVLHWGEARTDCLVCLQQLSLRGTETSSEVRSCSLGVSQRQLVRIPIQIPLCLWQFVAPNAEVELRNLLSLFKFIARSLLLLLRARSHPVLAQHLQQRPGSPSQCSGGLSSMLLPAVSSWLVFPCRAGDRRGQAG